MKKQNPQLKRIKLVESEDFEVSGEFLGDGVALHLDLRRWSPSVYKNLLEVVDSLRVLMPDFGISYLWVFIPVGDEKLLKFETMLGFKKHRESKTHVWLTQPCYLPQRELRDVR